MNQPERDSDMVKRVPAPECLGEIAASYCGHCSEVCPLTALCVLMSMAEYLRQDYKVPPTHDPSENR